MNGMGKSTRMKLIIIMKTILLMITTIIIIITIRITQEIIIERC